MNVSPRAGQPADLSMLVKVPKLVTAYYTQVPDSSVRGQRVTFGTSGFVVPHSPRPSTSGISSPSVRPFACTASSQGFRPSQN